MRRGVREKRVKLKLKEDKKKEEKGKGKRKTGKIGLTCRANADSPVASMTVDLVSMAQTEWLPWSFCLQNRSLEQWILRSNLDHRGTRQEWMVVD